MAEQEKQLSSGEIKELQERAKKLAMEKSYLQLVQQMITNIGESSGLENVIHSMLTNTMNVLGGSNLKIYYKIDEQLYYADVMGENRKLETFPDEVIARVYSSGQAEELEADFDQTRLQTPKFTKAYTWIYPLLANNEVIAVCRLENLSMDLQQIYGQLPAFFNYGAMVLKNEILGHSHLQELNEQLEAEVTARKQTEKKLRLAKENLEAAVTERTAELTDKKEELDIFFTSALDLLCIADTEGYFRKLNPEWERALGYPLDELVGRKFLDLIHPDDLESTLQAIATLSDQNPLLSFTNRYLHKDGTYRWLEWRSYPVGNKIYASARDITERMKIESDLAERTEELITTNKQLQYELEERKAYMEKLAQSEKHYHDLIHQLQTAVVVHGPDTSIQIYNQLACDLLGLTPEQLQGNIAYDPAWHFFDEQGEPLTPEHYPVNRVIATRQPLRDLTLGIHRPFSNDRRWVLLNANPILSAGGEILQVVTTFLDISARKQMENIQAARLRLLQKANEYSLDDLLEAALNEAEQLTGSCIGFFHFVEEDQQTLWLQNWSTRTKAEFCKAEGKGLHYPVSDAGVWADALRKKRALIHNDYASLPNKLGMPEGHAEVIRELVVPVQRGDRITAIMGVGNKASNYSEEDVQAVTFMADLAWDVAEVKRAQESLALNEKKLSEAQRMGHLGNWHLDLQSNELEWSDEIFRIFEIDRQQFAASYEAFLAVIHPDDREKVDLAYSESIKNHQPYEIVHRLLMADGRIKYVQEQCETHYDESGKALYSVGTVHDITELKLAEEEIRRFNSELEQIVEERTEKLNETNKRLESFNELMAEREMRVVEVKQEVNLLSNKLGLPMPYKEVWDALQE